MTRTEIITEWVRRLRSGIKQGREYLRTTVDGQDYYCCLGVLCEMAVEQKVIPPPVKVGMDWLGCKWETILIRIFHGLPSGYYRYEGNGRTLPPTVSQWAGVTPRGEGYGIASLARLNDWDHFDFNQIANVIEDSLIAQEFNQIADVIEGSLADEELATQAPKDRI
jgi:hypothetical protein